MTRALSGSKSAEPGSPRSAPARGSAKNPTFPYMARRGHWLAALHTSKGLTRLYINTWVTSTTRRLVDESNT